MVGYTYYSFRGPNGGMRAQGKGWRLDYTLVGGGGGGRGEGEVCWWWVWGRHGRAEGELKARL